MTKHTPIESGVPAQAPGTPARKRSSLLERADAAFGLDNIRPVGIPARLRETEAPQRESAREPAREPAIAVPVNQPQQATVSKDICPLPAAQPRPEPAVKLCGSYAKVDRNVLRAEGLIVPGEPITGLLEEFRIIKRELLSDARASGEAISRRILVCSPHSGEGKTFCAANLAIALSTERDVEVLLIDADVMQPSIARRFGIEGGPGIMDAIVDRDQNPEELAIKTDIEGLFIMPAGSRSARDAEYLSSARTGQILDRLTRGAPNRFLIFDTPPALAASPAAELAAHVGQALLVVRADETSRAAIEDAQHLLSACPDIKLLLNAAQFSPSGRRFGDYGETEE